jgi:hypothetical protein
MARGGRGDPRARPGRGRWSTGYKTMLDDEFDFGFAVDWMRKDLGICLDRNGAALPSPRWSTTSNGARYLQPAGHRAGRPVLQGVRFPCRILGGFALMGGGRWDTSFSLSIAIRWFIGYALSGMRARAARSRSFAARIRMRVASGCATGSRNRWRRQRRRRRRCGQPASSTRRWMTRKASWSMSRRRRAFGTTRL